MDNTKKKSFAETNRTKIHKLKQLSNIINFCSNGINKGINELSEGVCDLPAQLSLITKECNYLTKTVGNLSNEIRLLSAELPVTKTVPEHEDNIVRGNQEVERGTIGSRISRRFG